MAASLVLLLVVLIPATLWRAHRRAERAEADYPPVGDFVLVGGRRVHYVQQGQGPDVVLIHGASGNLRDLQSIAARLAQRYRVTIFDRPGLGYTEAVEDNASLSRQAAQLREAAALLGAPSPIVVGQSFGGSVALAWALDAPPPALVLISAPSMPWPGKLDIWYRLTASLIGPMIVVPLAAALVPDSYGFRLLPGLFAPGAVPERYGDQIGIPLVLRMASLWNNAEQVNALRAQLVRMEPAYRGLAIPTELLHGAEDRIVPLPIHSEPLAALLPNAAFTVIPDAGHMPHHTHPDLVLAAIDRAAARAGLR